jgi:hypothetical protein
MSREEAKRRERLMSVIELCRLVKETGLDPFSVDTDYVLSIIREFFPNVKSLQDFCLDAEAIKELSSVIEKQSNWIEHQSTSLYKDPFLLERRIRELGGEKMAELFAQSWHPIVALEQMSITSLKDSMDYWKDLLPLDVRWTKKGPEAVETERASLEEAIKMGLISERDFTAELEALWEELKERVGEKGKMRYWDFIGAETYEETVWRAFIASFLVSYGYADLEVDRVEEETFIIPYKEQKGIQTLGHTASIPVLVDYEEWKKWREEKNGERVEPTQGR